MGEKQPQKEQAEKVAEEAPPVKEEQENKKEEKTEEPPKPPSPFVLSMDLHCVGCAKKIQKSIMRIRGVEGVSVDMALNQVTIKGIVEPQLVCNKLTKKAKRRVKIISPLPPPEGDPIPEVVTSQVSGSVTVELNVNMHCEACADQLKKKILKMRGVQTAETEFSSGKVTVTGTMDANKLVDYVYRHTKKQAKIVPQPEPEPEPEPKPEKKEEGEKAAEEAKPEGEGEEKKEEKAPAEENDEKKDEGEEVTDDLRLQMMEEENMKRMMHYYHPMYVIERMPPAPQLFSDENPNACCIV